VRTLAQGLLGRGLSAERPVVILSGNSIAHALLGLAAVYVGVPYAPISTAYSLISSDHAKLKHIVGLLTPGLVFADDGAAFAAAIAAAVPSDVEVVTQTPMPSRATTDFTTLGRQPEGAALDAARVAVGPQTIAKFLFTSGSTGLPKGVVNTNGMLTSNQAMNSYFLDFVQHEPPILLDWLPWNHTFGCNHNFNLVLRNGGTLHIDGGKPTPAGIDLTVRNLRDIAPTAYYNVPKGYESLIPFFRADPALAKTFFSRLNLTCFAGAGMPRHVSEGLDAVAGQTCGERIFMLSGYGSTETAPSALFSTPQTHRVGSVGLPLPGVTLKLVPGGDKIEVRIKSPGVTPGYWREPKLTAAAFDEEGFYCFGDALRFADDADLSQGFVFDGRIAEDFKLATGTWVSVGALRTGLVQALAPFVKDVVIAGHDRDEVTALAFVDVEACRALDAGLAATEAHAVVAHPTVTGRVQTLLKAFAAASTGSASRVARLLLIEEAPSIDANEITDKGSINQRAVLKHRAACVEELYAESTSPRVVSAR
jgi:feruloyl-CoA synthase